MAQAAITGTGFYVPPKVLTNDDMKTWFDTDDQWIFERSGIRERHFIGDEPTGPSDLAVPAVQMALADAGISQDELELVVFATLSPDAYFPGAGCFLQDKMQLGNVPCLDIRMQCSGFIYGLSIAHQYILSGMYRTVLVVGSEVQSTSIDYSDEGRTVGVLFGDGAGAVVVQATDQAEIGIRSTHLYSQGKYARELWIEEPSSRYRGKFNPEDKKQYPYMNGREVFKHAVTRMRETVEEALEKNGWSLDSVDLIIPHQANYRIAAAIAEQLKLPMDKFFMNIHKYGNTTAASIPIALAEAIREGRAQKGNRIILTAFGSGFTWGSAALVI